MTYSNLTVTLPADLTGARRFAGVSGKLFTGTENPSNADEAMVHVILVDANNTPLVTRVDMDSGGGTAYRMGVGLLVAASGGPALVPGDATNGLKVQLASPATLPVSLASVPSHAVTNAGTFAVQDATAQASLSVLDDWDESDRAKVNIIAGQVGVQGGSGSSNALTQRVVLATDVGLPAGTAVIGKVMPTETTVAISVPSGQTLSTGIDSAGYKSFGIWVPSTFDGTTIDFQVSHSGAGGTYLPLYTAANALVSITVSPSRAYALPADLAAWRYWAINCGTSQSTSSTDFFVTMRS